MPTDTPEPWWMSTVCYQIYVRSFADGDGDGVGDLPGIRARLDHIARLGADAIWLTPFCVSPQHDHGYDVADYRDVDPLFGSLDDFRGLVGDAHDLGLKVVVDVVPNHTSNEHPWFRKAVADPDSPYRDRYLFRDASEDGGPPNNWGSIFGGPAWSPDPAGTGQWYLHLFAPEQPDLDWSNPRVREEMRDVLRFWLDLGVDGFRIDVAHGLVKDADLADNPERPDPDGTLVGFDRLLHVHDLDQDGVHEIYRDWRSLVDAYPGDRALVGEVFLWEPDRVARYVRPDELHLAFNFLLLGQKWELAGFRDAIEMTIEALDEVGATPTWVLSNHDVEREVTRFGGGEQGRRRAAAALCVILALPGSVFIYQGAELGLGEVDVPPAFRQDPVERHPEIARKGRDGRRVPLPWEPGPAPGYGFTTGEPWLPTPEDWGEHSVASQEADGRSMLQLYRRALATRRELPVIATGDFAWADVGRGCLAFRRSDGQRSLLCVANMGERAARVDVTGGELVLASGDGAAIDGTRLHLPPGVTAWVAADV